MRIHDTEIFLRIRFLTFLGKILTAFHNNHSHNKQSFTKTTIGTNVVGLARAVNMRPARCVAARSAIYAPALASGVIQDPEQYDFEANSGRGSGFVPSASVPAPMKVTYGSDGVIYDHEANILTGGVIYTPKDDVLSTMLSAPASSTGPVSLDDVIAAQKH